MRKAYLGVGSNIGDARANVLEAYRRILEESGVGRGRLSPLYRTAPVGFVDQEWFVNGVIEIYSDCDPMSLLGVCQDVEKGMKRVRRERWGPRIIDLDILWMDGVELMGDGLQIPHARAHERAFVLRPWADLDSSVVLNGRSVFSWLDECADQEIEKCL